MSVLFLDPRVERHLIADEGEVIVDEVRKHWAAVFGPILELLAIIPVVLLLGWLPSGAYWLPVFAALALLLHALWRMLGMRMDRFVVTNMRVFRVHGILSQHVATMPISRILDISVHTPIIGRIFNYGHFVFESAAQEQGLREIRYVGSPTQARAHDPARHPALGPPRRRRAPAEPPGGPATAIPPGRLRPRAHADRADRGALVAPGRLSRARVPAAA